jgi:hypothetical protein
VGLYRAQLLLRQTYAFQALGLHHIVVFIPTVRNRLLPVGEMGGVYQRVVILPAVLADRYERRLL